MTIEVAIGVSLANMNLNTELYVRCSCDGARNNCTACSLSFNNNRIINVKMKSIDQRLRHPPRQDSKIKNETI